MDLLDFINGRVSVHIADNEQANTLYHRFQDEVPEDMIHADIPWYHDDEYSRFPYIAIRQDAGGYIADGFINKERVKLRVGSDVEFIEYNDFINSENCQDVIPDIDVNEVI